MPPTLENIVPWGRSFDEYQRMFSLDSNDLRGSILGFADGPASFNAELTEMGKSVVSFDPIYQFTAAEIGSRIEAVAPRMIDYAAQHADEFVWTSRLPDVTTLAKQRRQAMSRFLDDFADGLDAGRYVAAEVAVPLTKRAAARWAFARSRWSLESIERNPRSPTPQVAVPLTERAAARSSFARSRWSLESSESRSKSPTPQVPNLPFADRQFDLTVCSHFLFLYSQQLSLQFHVAAIEELLRVAKEVRIFPLLQLDSQKSPYVEPITATFRQAGRTVEHVVVDYEFQRGANQMMRIQ